MLRNCWKILRTVVLTVGVLLSLFAAIEILRAYQTLYQLHPFAAFLFLGLLACGIGGIVIYLVVGLMSRPPVLIPPEIGDRNNATNRELCRYRRYLTKYIGRLSSNGVLSTEDRDKAKEGMAKLGSTTDIRDNNTETLLMAAQEAEEQTVKPLLAKLDEEANKEIRACVRIVMAGVTLSPYKAADLIIVLYRNLAMVIRIIRIYNSRPRFREQLWILADTISIVATVNYINMSKSLLEGLGSKVPVIGKYMDDIAQGIGAGFMTSVTGHAAMGRCRCFSGWNEEEAKNNLRNRASYFYADVKGMFTSDILPGITNRVGAVTKESLDKIGTGIHAALDETGNVIGRFVKVPVKIATGAGTSAMKAGTSGRRAIIRTGTKACSSAARKVRSIGLGVLRGVGSAGGKALGYSKSKTRTTRKLMGRKKY